jgi:hypothetical protein
VACCWLAGWLLPAGCWALPGVSSVGSLDLTTASCGCWLALPATCHVQAITVRPTDMPGGYGTPHTPRH